MLKSFNNKWNMSSI